MDNVTHTLIGAGIANAFLRRRLGPAAVPVLAIASNLPDLDVLVHVAGDPAAVTLRRSFGHSLFLLPVWSLLLALVLRRFYRIHGTGTLFAASLLGASVHVVFDLVNSFGVLLLWPLSAWRPELAMVFIIDLALFGLVALPPFLCLPKHRRPLLVPVSRAALLAAACYLSVCGAGRWAADRLLERAEPAAFSYVFPEPFGPHRWRGVARHGDSYTLWLLRPFSGDATRVDRVATRPDHPAARAARASPLGRRLEGFFKAPVWEVGAEAGPGAPAAVCAYDLRFRSLVLDRGTAFRFCFRVGRDGTVERAGDRLLAHR